MTINHHPDEEALAAFAAGTLDEPRSVVVAAHVAMCPHCRATIAAFEQLGGTLVERAVPAASRTGSLDQALARLDEAAPRATVSRQPEPDCPAVLAPYEVGRWRWIGPGVHWRGVEVPESDGTRVFMLKAAPGSSLPHHGHSGIEWTCVLQGAFRHDLGRYGPAISTQPTTRWITPRLLKRGMSASASSPCRAISSCAAGLENCCSLSFACDAITLCLGS